MTSDAAITNVGLERVGEKSMIRVSRGGSSTFYTPEELTAAVRADPYVFMGLVLFSSSCDFPEEEGFSEDFYVQELIAKAICAAKELTYIWLQKEDQEPRIGLYRGSEEAEPLYSWTEFVTQIEVDPDSFRRGCIFDESCDHPTLFGFPSHFDVRSTVATYLRYHPRDAEQERDPAYERLIAAGFKALTALNTIPNTTINKKPKVTSYDIASELERALAAICTCELCDLPAVKKYQAWRGEDC